jgi:carboxylate-amine ligase
MAPFDESAAPAAAAALDAVRAHDLQELAAAARAAVVAGAVTFSSDGDPDFHLDPVPRVIAAEDWAPLEAGLAQRVRALDRFAADANGEREIVAAGVVPARVIDSCEYLEPGARGVRPAGECWVGVAGIDVVRDPAGMFLVLEDNLRTPSGIAYAVAARLVTLGLLDPAADAAPRAHENVGALLRWTLSGACPDGELRHGAVLTDGRDNSAHWEHARLAEAAGLPLVEPSGLEPAGDGLRIRGGQVLDALYRRTDADALDDPVGALLGGPWRAGRLGLVNGYGLGVADDKLAHAYVEDMVRFYLGEEPLLPSVRTYDLAEPAVLEEALDRLDELVVKPRSGYGGHGVVICAHAERSDLELLRSAVRAAPGTFIAQDLVVLSEHPTLIDGRLEPRHVDLRPFVFLGPGREARVLPGGLTRVALDAGSLVVNSSQNGGAKDTWIC